jgi:hypothetical protein
MDAAIHESDHNNLKGNDEDNENYSELEYKSEREDFEEDMTFEVLNNDRGGQAIWVNGTPKYLICKPKDVFYLRCADWKRLGCGARGICRKLEERCQHYSFFGTGAS